MGRSWEGGCGVGAGVMAGMGGGGICVGGKEELVAAVGALADWGSGSDDVATHVSLGQRRDGGGLLARGQRLDGDVELELARMGWRLGPIGGVDAPVEESCCWRQGGCRLDGAARAARGAAALLNGAAWVRSLPFPDAHCVPSFPPLVLLTWSKHSPLAGGRTGAIRSRRHSYPSRRSRYPSQSTAPECALRGWRGGGCDGGNGWWRQCVVEAAARRRRAAGERAAT